MSFKIVRGDITKMNTEAIVNTASSYPEVTSGCELAIYIAAGYDELLTYRKEKIGVILEGDIFITPGFALQAKYIIHAVCHFNVNGRHNDEKKLRSCYSNSLNFAKKHGIKSISFPVISTGEFGYSLEEGIRIAVTEIKNFLAISEMEVYLVVFDDEVTSIGYEIFSKLEEYIEQFYEGNKVSGDIKSSSKKEQYTDQALDQREDKSPETAIDSIPAQENSFYDGFSESIEQSIESKDNPYRTEEPHLKRKGTFCCRATQKPKALKIINPPKNNNPSDKSSPSSIVDDFLDDIEENVLNDANENILDEVEEDIYLPSKSDKYSRSIWKRSGNIENVHAHKTSSKRLDDELDWLDRHDYYGIYEDEIDDQILKLEARMEHLSDTFSQYLLYLISQKGLENADVWKNALVDKKIFSKIKNNPDYHPTKLTALCLCVGARLDIDETVELLARAGYALSPCDKTDIIFAFYLENGIYNMVSLDIQLEEHGLPCIIK